MSRQAQLPPRCPLQKKAAAYQSDLPVSQSSCKKDAVTELYPRQYGHHKSMSQSSILEEQPAWLDNLLSESDTNFMGPLHRRSASDSLTLFAGLEALPDVDQHNGVETADSCEPDDGLGSSCSYGPNSPRRKNKLGFPEKDIVSAISKYVMQSPLQHLNRYISVSGAPQSDSLGDTCASVGEMNTANRPMKCHQGQRSRARKLHYIAELERTVDLLQNLGSELTVTIASHIQHHTALLMENDMLKQQLLRMQQEKFIVDGQYLSLKKEVEKLKTSLAASFNGKVCNKPYSAAAYLARSDGVWNTLDMRKLDLN